MSRRSMNQSVRFFLQNRAREIHACLTLQKHYSDAALNKPFVGPVGIYKTSLMALFEPGSDRRVLSGLNPKWNPVILALTACRLGMLSDAASSEGIEQQAILHQIIANAFDKQVFAFLEACLLPVVGGIKLRHGGVMPVQALREVATSSKNDFNIYEIDFKKSDDELLRLIRQCLLEEVEGDNDPKGVLDLLRMGRSIDPGFMCDPVTVFFGAQWVESHEKYCLVSDLNMDTHEEAFTEEELVEHVCTQNGAYWVRANQLQTVIDANKDLRRYMEHHPKTKRYKGGLNKMVADSAAVLGMDRMAMDPSYLYAAGMMCKRVIEFVDRYHASLNLVFSLKGLDLNQFVKNRLVKLAQRTKTRVTHTELHKFMKCYREASLQGRSPCGQFIGASPGTVKSLFSRWSGMWHQKTAVSSGRGKYKRRRDEPGKSPQALPDVAVAAIR